MALNYWELVLDKEIRLCYYVFASESPRCIAWSKSRNRGVMTVLLEGGLPPEMYWWGSGVLLVRRFGLVPMGAVCSCECGSYIIRFDSCTLKI